MIPVHGLSFFCFKKREWGWGKTLFYLINVDWELAGIWMQCCMCYGLYRVVWLNFFDKITFSLQLGLFFYLYLWCACLQSEGRMRLLWVRTHSEPHFL